MSGIKRIVNAKVNMTTDRKKGAVQSAFSVKNMSDTTVKDYPTKSTKKKK
jgi:hypothetical protein